MTRRIYAERKAATCIHLSAVARALLARLIEFELSRFYTSDGSRK